MGTELGMEQEEANDFALKAVKKTTGHDFTRIAKPTKGKNQLSKWARS